MTIIKKLRTQRGYTQKMLAQKSSLSLRTIQRLEAVDHKPKGYTLNALAAAFDIPPDDLMNQYTTDSPIKSDSKQFIRWINFSSLACMVIPFGNIILPTWLFNKFSHWDSVKTVGRKLVNFQIIWTILLCMALCIAPFIDSSSSDPLILWVLLGFMLINITVILINAVRIQKNDLRVIHLGIELI